MVKTRASASSSAAMSKRSAATVGSKPTAAKAVTAATRVATRVSRTALSQVIGRHRHHHGVHAADDAGQHGRAGGQHPAADEQARDAEREREARRDQGATCGAGREEPRERRSPRRPRRRRRASPGASKPLDRRLVAEDPGDRRGTQGGGADQQHHEPEGQQDLARALGRRHRPPRGRLERLGARRSGPTGRPARGSRRRRCLRLGLPTPAQPRGRSLRSPLAAGGPAGAVGGGGRHDGGGYSRRLARDGLVRRVAPRSSRSRTASNVASPPAASPSTSPIGPKTAECPQ